MRKYNRSRFRRTWIKDTRIIKGMETGRQRGQRKEVHNEDCAQS